MSQLPPEIAKRRTFAIISHPDAGKTTITEKLLLHGRAVQVAGTVKAKKSGKHVTSDWMEMEKQRGISITTSVMQFPYRDHIINLLDTPGHEDFSEDTYRTLTAVDSALMVIDGAKGVEERTIKLMEVCRMRDTPIITFVNKLDRDIREAVDLLDEIESVLKIRCAPITWPIGMGKEFKGVYHRLTQEVWLYEKGRGEQLWDPSRVSLDDQEHVRAALGSFYDELMEEIELIEGACDQFDVSAFLKGELTPVFFGTALGNFGVAHVLDALIDWAPAPSGGIAQERHVGAEEPKFTGFVFKIQANMDPNHRDRVAFMRIVSGRYRSGMKVRHVRTGKDIKIANALTFFAGDRERAEEAWAGDIIGVHNHGTIQIGDTFTEGEVLNFTGIPHFAPELFRRIRLRDPLKTKQLLKGLVQLSEEGATQVFRPLDRNDLIVGAVGQLQFDVVAQRLKDEYGVDCLYEPVNVTTARWVSSDDPKELERFKNRVSEHLALDGGDYLTYLAPSRVNLNLAMERWPKIKFSSTREHAPGKRTIT